MSKPPNNGPIRYDTPKTAPIIPSALPRFSGGNVSPMKALATGKIPPAPKPCIALPTSRIFNDGEVAVINDPIPNKDTS